MSGSSIASRPSMDQVVAIVSFMEKHPDLGLGVLRGLEGREVAKKLWLKLTRIVNDTTGPTRPMKSWMKYWADKKSQVRNKVVSGGGDSNILTSNIEKKIWDLFLSSDTKKSRESVKQETQYFGDSFCNDDSMDQTHVESEVVFAGDETLDPEDRQLAIMEKLVKVMGDQSSAMEQLAHAATINSRAMERLAEAAHIQARAADRLAGSLETVGAATHDIRNAIVDIDNTMKRFYSPSGT